MRTKHLFLLSLLACTIAAGQTLQQSSNEELIAKFKPLPAPKVDRLTLKTGDRLAICGDSITEQRMYSRIIEDYLAMCAPELKVAVRQYGWSGEKAAGFLARMTNDCLEFKPTIATTCYGMNDHEYKPYEDRIGKTYEEKSTEILEAFKANGVRVVQGSPGCVGRVPGWAKTTNDTVEDLNLSLCRLRNIGIELAAKEKEEFADVFWPMLTVEEAARAKYGPDYAISGQDGVHPGWAGHTVMAYAFLKAFGLDGEIGTFTVDLGKDKMKVSKGHKLVSAKDGAFEIESARYPFCACVPAGREVVPNQAKYPTCDQDNVTKDGSIRSAMTLIPFNAELNRLILVGRNPKAKEYTVNWGERSKTFSAEQLAAGVNLAAEFPENPFNAAFASVDAAVAAKQGYETKQVKQMLHSQEAKTDMAGIVAQTEKEREPLVAAIHAAFVPVTHTIRIVPRD